MASPWLVPKQNDFKKNVPKLEGGFPKRHVFFGINFRIIKVHMVTYQPTNGWVDAYIDGFTVGEFGHLKICLTDNQPPSYQIMNWVTKVL